MKKFEEYVKENIVKKITPDFSRAKSLKEEAQKRKQFLEKLTLKLPLTDENANYYLEHIYDIIMELIRAKMLKDGYKSSGLGAHEAEISYLKNQGFKQTTIDLLDELRYFRNGIKYYGKKLDEEYAQKCLELLKQNYDLLKKLI